MAILGNVRSKKAKKHRQLLCQLFVHYPVWRMCMIHKTFKAAGPPVKHDAFKQGKNELRD